MGEKWEEFEVVIVGAGIAGLATALALKRVGVRALVLERSEGLRATGAALTLSHNAWLALDALGVAHKLSSLYAPLKKGYFTNVATGAVQEVQLGDYDSSSQPRTVHRKALLEALAAELPPEAIRFSSKFTSIETQSQGEKGLSSPILRMEDGTLIRTKALIGCDGVHSGVARWLGLSEPIHSGRGAVRGMAEYPQGHGLRHEVQQFLDDGIRAGFVPTSDKSVYWFLVCNSTFTDKETGRRHEGPELIQKEVLETAKDFPQVYRDVVQHSDLSTLSWAQLMFRVPWNIIFGNLSRGGVTVAGDAMHPMTPDLGQGGCSALEDAVVLGRHIGNSYIRNGRLLAGDVADALQNYARERRWRVAGLITGSYLSGWTQQAGSAWWRKFLRDAILYRFLFRHVLNSVRYDCGKLPELKG